MEELYLIPYAGGTSLSYSTWHFTRDIRCIALDYKGHGLRRNELLDKDFSSIVDDICEQIIHLTQGGNISVFGHSMGGLVGWKAARCLQELGFKIKLFFPSACIPPHLFRRTNYKSLSTEQGLMEYIRSEKRLSEHQIESKCFRENIYPATVNDYMILASCPIQNVEKSDFSILCFYGIDDPMMPSTDMIEWQLYTSDAFGMQSFNGNHYYIEDEVNKETLIRTIDNTLLA